MIYPWLIFLAPLASAACNLAGLCRRNKMAATVSVIACAVSFLVAIQLFFVREIVPAGWDWIDVGGPYPLRVEMNWILDPLSRLMLLIVAGVGLLVHFFSLGYMSEDKSEGRFFGELSLFMFSMFGIVVANNFIMMFIFWELVGLSSYLLIGFWFEKPAAANAAKKAFIVNRIGDFGFMLGILLFWSLTGTIMFDPQAAQAIGTHPAHIATLLSLLLFCGCVGKSAMFPLHVWLPDAMEGPTPVSALIHAATMVAAGIYMIVRIFFILQFSPSALDVIAYVGGFTALFAALIALQQSDIKRILAYSTLSQLGYMVMAVGCSAPGAAMFHLTTHAFFKALLFLGAGSVIHAVHHEQNIWKMGGLAKKMKVTFWTFLIGTLALTGFPGLSGFFSKDEIIQAAGLRHPLLYFSSLFTAALTAFYMARLIIVAFLGDARSKEADHAHETNGFFIVPLIILAIPSALAGYCGLQGYFDITSEVKGWITMLLSLAAFAIGVGLAWVLYRKADSEPIRIPLLEHKFYFDEFYDSIVVKLQQAIARIFAWFDNWILGGIFVRGTGSTVQVSGEFLRLFQTGNLQAYAFLFSLGAVVIIYFTLFY